jgi:methylmalonyl-CoA mutase cobalamin-binding subunit
MAAVAVAAGGKRPLVLPGETPVAEIVAAVTSTRASLVAISLSSHSRSPAHHEQLHLLRAALPDDYAIWVGGQGAPEPSDGIHVVCDLTKLSE